MKWEEIIKIFEEYKDLNNTEIAAKIGKSRTWISRARKFYEATDDEKKQLALDHPQFTIFYENWLTYKKEKELIANNTEEKIEIFIDLLKTAVIRLTDCQELKNTLLKENAETALDINRLYNHKAELEKELATIKNELKYYKSLFYGGTITIILILILSPITHF